MDDRPRARRDPGARSSRGAERGHAHGAAPARNGGADRSPGGFAAWRQAARSELGFEHGGDPRAEAPRPGGGSPGAPPRPNGGAGGLLSGWGGGSPGGRGGPRVSGAPEGGGSGNEPGAGHNGRHAPSNGGHAPGNGSRGPRVEPEDRRNSWSGRTGARSGPAKPTWSRWEDRDADRGQPYTDASAAAPAWTDQTGQAGGWTANERAWAGESERVPTWSSWDDDPHGAGGFGGASAWPGQADFADPRGGARPPRGVGSSNGRGRSGGGRLTTMRRRLMSTPGGRALAVFLCAAILLSCVSSLFAAPAVYDLVLARQGIQHLKNAETDFKALAHNPLNGDAIAQAHDELAAAYSDFSQVNATIGLYSGLLTISPHYHSMLEGARALLPVVIEASQAGMIGCDMLSLVSSKLKDPLDASSPGLTTADMATIDQDAAQVFAIVNTVIPQLNALPPSVNNLDPRIGPALASFRQSLPQIQGYLREAQVWLAAAPGLLGIGQQTNYLVEVLDSTEVRAGGGFIGNYGVIEMRGGKVSMHLQDVTLLDNQGLGINDQYPPQGYDWLYEGAHANFYGFRESNLEGDFPWSAQNGEQMYEQEGQNDQTAHLYTLTPGGPVPVQGVIAVTPWVIQDAMKITGGVYLPEFKTTVTWDTLVDDIHVAQLGKNMGNGHIYNPIAGSSQRKLFSEYLFKHFFAKVKSSLSTDGGKLVALFQHALYTKDVQVYLNDPTTEALLRKHHMDSSIEAPAKGDSLMVVDANVNAEKDNYFMTYLMQDQVTLDEQGNATHQMTLTFNFPASNHTKDFDFGHLDINYWDWMRVYVPPGSTVVNDGWGIQSTATMFNRQVWAGPVGLLVYPGSLTVTLSWVVPNAAYKDAHGWHYTELLQRQAGLVRPVNMQVTLPQCAAHIAASVTQASGGAAPIASAALPPAAMPGALVPDPQIPTKPAQTVDALLAGITGHTPSISHQTVTLNQVLTEDHTIAINYTCGS